MTELPPAPPTPPTLDSTPPTEPRTLLPAIGLVVLLVVIAGALFTFLRAEPTVKPVASPAPSEAPSFRTFTQEEIDKKSDVAAFFIQRGQNQGAAKVMQDFLEGTGCRSVWSGYQTFSGRRVADAKTLEFRQAAAQQFPTATVISTGISEIEPASEFAPDKFLVAGIVLDCPRGAS